MIVVLMGVSGSGKSTVGRLLAQRLGWRFIEADDYHPPANVEKLTAGVPLTDDDRRPWLAAVKRQIDEACARGESVVVACSALKHAYQEYLERDSSVCVEYVYLHGSPELIRERLAHRTGHFMNPRLLPSQFQTLESPVGAITVDVSPTPEEIAAEIQKKLGL